MYLVTAAEMQAMDRQTIESFGIPGRVLMENAGRGATRFLLEQMKNWGDVSTIGVLAGRGNNGGDGFVMARYLAQTGLCVKVYLLSAAAALKGDAAANFALLAPLDIELTEIPDQDRYAGVQSTFGQVDCWIDAVLGTGLKSVVKGYYAHVIESVNRQQKPVFAVDVPSGMDADTGQILGTAIAARATATFGYSKIGHWLYPGAALTGELAIVDIGIPSQISRSIGPQQALLTAAAVKTSLPHRSADAHKGSSGHLMVIAGSSGKTGAATMTALAASRAGAGLVTLGIAKSLNPIVENQLLEAMTLPLPESGSGELVPAASRKIIDAMADKKCLALGPGLGLAETTGELVRKLIKAVEVPMVIDADGINHLAGQTDLLKDCHAPIILTPHPGEMARLIGESVTVIQKDRIGSARRFATEYQVHLVLKGARTVVAHPDGKVIVNPTGNSGMASGGMGDVLTGAIAGLLTQGMTPGQAAQAGVFLHGAAADELAERIGSVGYLAGDVIAALPQTIKSVQKGRLPAIKAYEELL